MKGKKESLTPYSYKTNQKGSVLEQIKIRRKEKDALKKKLPGVTPPVAPRPAAPPRTVAPATQGPSKPREGEPEGNVLEVLFARAMRNRSDTKPANDPGMAMMQALAHQVQTGQPISQIEDIVVPHLGEMSSKIHLWRNALAYHDMFERGALITLARWTLEKSLWDDLINNRLSPTEKLALLNLAVKESDKIASGLGDYQKNLESGGKGTVADIAMAAEKVDRQSSKVEDPTSKDLEGTSAVGRELARRMLNRAGKASEKIIDEALGET